MEQPANADPGSTAPRVLAYATPNAVGPSGVYCLKFACPSCGGRLRVVGAMLGEPMVCCHCETAVTVPDPAPAFIAPALGPQLALRGCPYCDHPLEGLGQNLCPACGRRFDVQQLLLSHRSGVLQRPGLVFGLILTLWVLSWASRFFG